MQSKYFNLILSIAGAALLWMALPPLPFTFLLFVAWLPLLMIADNVKSFRNFFAYVFLHMLIWNVLTTWWVAMSTLAGGLSAFLANSFFMCIPWLLYFFSKKYLNQMLSLLALIFFWIAYEYIHHNWDLSWPWLTLGNAFAMRTSWIQWYEYTGVSGGTLWILLANVLLFIALKIYNAEGRSISYFKYLAGFAIVICLPIIVSKLVQNRTLTLHHNKYNVVVVQPNVDPWNEKFNSEKQDAQLQKLISLSQEKMDANTAIVVWPETAIPRPMDETTLKENIFLEPMWNFLKQNPQLNLLTGIEGFKTFQNKKSRSAKRYADSDLYYENYNTAALFNADTVQIYHKSKLVPGVETLPRFLNFMSDIFDKFGGTTNGYTRNDSAVALRTFRNIFTITPAVCYESIYGDYLSEFNRQGADIICIITNDGWWGNTPGYKQHKDYARLRAIESRKWVARSANTGISCFIDPYGNVVQQLGWNQQGALKQQIAAMATETFFTKHGDLLSRISLWIVAAFLVLIIILKIKHL
jgi:apolipoprotein N-acyltransferase